MQNGVAERWDAANKSCHEQALLTVAFSDFASGNPNYERLRAILSAGNIVDAHPVEAHNFKVEKPTPQQAKALFVTNEFQERSRPVDLSLIRFRFHDTHRHSFQ